MITKGPDSLLIESGSRAVFEWDSFSLASSESIRFEQLDSHSAVLNRVLGGPSEILGKISSNGAVFLINSQGILIGPGAQIDTMGFLASSLDVLDADFLAERALVFSGEGTGSVVNWGTISCPEGNIALLSREKVENHGSLIAKEGSAILAVGSEILLQPEKAPRVLIRAKVEAQKAREGASLLNEGAIQALTAELKSGSSVYEKAIQNAGLIEAFCFEEKGGEIFLIAEKGICEVTGDVIANCPSGKGGTVHILGEKVGIWPGSHVEASGKTGGGTILVGGDFQGKNPEIQNAKMTYVGPDTSLRADAWKNGDGGKIIVWSDGATFAYGHMSVRGGEEGGDGGLNEVSGRYLDPQMFSDRRAPKGKCGFLLLDPLDVTVTAAANSNVTFNAGTRTYDFTACAAGSNIQDTSLTGNLATGNVIIDTSAPVGGGANTCGEGGTITISTAISWSTATTLILSANRNIVISAAITCNAAGSFTAMNFKAFGDGQTGTFHGIQISSTGSLVCSNGGDIFLSGIGGPNGSAKGISVEGAVTATNGSVTFLDCHGGGFSSGNDNIGVDILAAVTAGTVISFTNVTGGGRFDTTGNHGVRVVADATFLGTLSAPSILATSVVSGGGIGSDVGFFVHGGIVGSTITTTGITIIASSIGRGTFEPGIYVANNPSGSRDGRIQTNSSGFINLIGTGGGVSTLAGSASYGILLNNNDSLNTIISAGSGGVTLIGKGGAGTGGGHNGVQVNTASMITSNGGAITFKDCSGGIGSTGANVGVRIDNQIVSAGALNFSNIVGGDSGTFNIGVHHAAGNLSATSVTATGIKSGIGSGNTYGFWQAGGNITVTSSTGISITALSQGTGSNEKGIIITAGTLSATSGSIILNGTGSFAGTGSSNHGVSFEGGTLTPGTGGLTITGKGGQGSGASIGVNVGASISLSTANTPIVFRDCIGGIGGDANYGILIDNQSVASTGSGSSITFSDITGGGGVLPPTGQFQFGLLLVGASASVNAPTITATNITSGQGTDYEPGLYIVGGSFGSTATTSLTVIASSNALGTGDGITVDRGTNGGVIQVGDGGSMFLSGTGTSFGTGRGILLTTGVGVSGTVIRGGANSTLTIIGNGGGASSSGGSYGIIWQGQAGIEITGAGTTSRVTLTGRGGRGSGGGHQGVSASGGITLTFGGTGTFEFKNCSGGTGGTLNHGVLISGATLAAPTIVASDCVGGTGVNSNIGFYVSGGVLGGASTTSIAITASSLGTGGSEAGVVVDGAGAIRAGAASGTLTLNGTGSSSGISACYGILINSSNATNALQVGTGGTISLIGKGGGATTGSGNSNYGVWHLLGILSPSTGGVTYTGAGGAGSGGSHHGVVLETAVSIAQPMTFRACRGGTGGNTNTAVAITSIVALSSGTLTFTDCIGGSGGLDNRGIWLTSTSNLSAPTIVANGISGGAGIGGDLGLYLNGGVLGGASTSSVSITATSLGTLDNEYGMGIDSTGAIRAGAAGGTITLNGTGSLMGRTTCYGILINSSNMTNALQVGTGGTITLIGKGGGATTGTGNSNYGIYHLQGILSPSTGGVFFSGSGGGGSSAGHHGVVIGSPISIAQPFTFQNCSGGTGGSGNSAILIASSIALSSGTLTFFDCIGGSNGSGGGTDNYGISINSLGNVSAPTIVASQIFGGPGSGSNLGLLISGGILGSATTTTSISITAGSAGNGSSEIGIDVTNASSMLIGTIQTNSSGSITLNGTGGGSLTGAGANNYGILLNNDFSVNSIVTAGSGGITLTGKGGLGTGGSHNGVLINTGGLSTSNAGPMTFNDCQGGNSAAGTGSNVGVRIENAITSAGILTFSNIRGGDSTAAGSNVGVYHANGNITATAVRVRNITSGTGVGNMFGFWQGNGNLTASSSSGISIRASSQGTGASEIGIHMSGGALIASSGPVILNGTGSAIATGTGNHGINLGGGTITPGTAGLTLTGTGGSGGSSSGINILTAYTLSNPLVFLDCIGGSAGSDNYGVGIAANVSATNISTNGVLGGPGVGNNFGFYLTGATLGGTSTTSVSLEAESLGSGGSEIGIHLLGAAKIQVGNNGTIELHGTGSRSGTLADCSGIRINATATNGLLAGTGANETGTIALIGNGGGTSASAGASNHGVHLLSTATITAGGTNSTGSLITFMGTGGKGSGGNHKGVFLQGAVNIPGTTGTIAFTNCSGGTGGTLNCGVQIASTLLAPTMTGSDLFGGAGAGNNIGFYLNGGTIGSAASAQTISLSAASLGTTTAETGILIDAGGQITTGSTGTISLTGTGSSSATSSSHGIHITGASSAVSSVNGALSLTGTAGSGTNSRAIFLEVSSSVTSSGSSNITFNSTNTSPIALAASSISTTTGNLLFNGPVLLTAVPTLMTGGSGNLTFASTLDGAFTPSLTVGGTLAFQGIVGGITPLASLTPTAAAISIGANITLSTPGTLTLSAPVTLTGNSVATTNGGAVTLSSTVNGTYDLTLASGGGSLTLSNAIGALTPLANLTVGGGSISLGANVTLADGAMHFLNPLTLTASPIQLNAGTEGGSMAFDAAVEGSGTAGSKNLTLLAGGEVVFSSTIGATNRLGTFSATCCDLTLTANATANSFTALAHTHLAAPVTINTSAAPGTIVLTGDLDGAQNLTLNAGASTISLTGGAIGATTPLAAFSATAATLTLASSLTAQSISVVADTALTGPVVWTSTTGSVSFNGDIDGSQSLTLNAATTLALSGGTIGAGTPLGALTASATLISLGESINMNNSPLTLNSPVSLTTAVTITSNGGDIRFNSTIDGTQNFTLNAGNGTIAFGNALGATTPLSTFSISQARTAFLNNNITAASISTSAPLIFTGSATLNTSAAGGNIVLSSPINAATSAGQALTLNAGAGTLQFGAPVGDSTPFSALTATASTITANGSHTISGPTVYNAPVTVTAPSTFSNIGAGGLAFQSSLTSTFDVALNAPSTAITVQGPTITSGVGVGAAGKTFTATAGGNITLSSIASIGGAESGGMGPNGGDVRILSTAGTITVGAITTSGADGAMLGGDAGEIFLQPGRGLSNGGALGELPEGRIVLSGNLTAEGGNGATDGSSGTISLSPAGRYEFPTIATITSTLVGNDVVLTGETLVMGPKEVMTILGNLEINLSSSMTIGDFIALDSLSISAPNVVLLEHGAVAILASDGSLYTSPTAHIIARESISINDVASINLSGTVKVFSQFTQSEFRDMLVLTVPFSLLGATDYILNFDLGEPIPPPISPVSPLTREQFVDRLLVADAQLQDLLPLFVPVPEQRPYLCWQEDEETFYCRPHVPLFISFLQQNGVK